MGKYKYLKYNDGAYVSKSNRLTETRLSQPSKQRNYRTTQVRMYTESQTIIKKIVSYDSTIIILLIIIAQIHK